MTRHTFTLVVVLTSLILFRCSEEAHEQEKIELTQEEISKIILQAVVEEQRNLDKIVLQYYNALDETVKEDMTFRHFNLDLALRYKRFTKRALEEFQHVDTDNDPDSEAAKLRESIREEEDIPEWYWQLRQRSSEKIKEITHQYL